MYIGLLRLFPSHDPVGETPYHLNEFIKTTGKYDGVTHITNTGGMGINIDEINEEVQYTFFTNA